MHDFIGKGCLCTFFLLLIASCTPSCRQWQLETACAACPNTPIAKLYLPPEASYCGLEIEFARCGSDVRMYINVFSVPFPCEVSSVEIKVSIDDVSFTSDVEVLEGGQRLLVPIDTTNQIIEALANCQTVSIRAGRYSSTLLSCNFADLFKQAFVSE